MGDVKTAYIFTKPEMLFLLKSISDISPAYPVRYILNTYLAASLVSLEAIAGLEYKKLIFQNAGKVSLEPIIDFLARSALSASKLWIINEDSENINFILKTTDMYMYIRSYPFINGAWRISSYKNLTDIMEELDASISSVRVIDNNGGQNCITPQNDFTWLEE